MPASNQPDNPIPAAAQNIQDSLCRLDEIEKITQKQRLRYFTVLLRRIKRRKVVKYILEQRDKLVRGFKSQTGLIFFISLCALIETIIATMNAKLKK